MVGLLLPYPHSITAYVLDVLSPSQAPDLFRPSLGPQVHQQHEAKGTAGHHAEVTPSTSEVGPPGTGPRNHWSSNDGMRFEYKQMVL
jgi:hypothetical protein